MINQVENIVDALRELMSNQADQTWNTIPGSILSYDKTTGTAQVKLEVKLPLSTGEIVEMPPIDNVPVQRMETEEVYIDMDFPKGTGCIILFSSVAIGNYLANTGNEVPAPENLSKCSLTDAIAIPGLYPKKKKPNLSNAVQISIGGGEIKVTTPAGSTIESSGSSMLINNNLEVLL